MVVRVHFKYQVEGGYPKVAADAICVGLYLLLVINEHRREAR